MNRRNFFKFLAKGAAIVGAAGVFGLPKVEAKKEYKDILAGKDDGIYFSNNGDIVEIGTFDIPAGFPDDSYPVKFESGYVTAWTTEQRKQFAREVIEAEKQLPGLMPMWEIEYSTQSSTHWPNDTRPTILVGDIVTWTTLELGLDEDDEIINLEYVFGEIQLTTKKGRYFLSKDGKEFTEYWPNYYFASA